MLATAEIILLTIGAIIGFVAGIASGLFGIGGGSIRIPLLKIAGFSLILAFGINLLALPVTASIGAASQRKNIDLRLGLYMVLGGSLGTIVGSLIAFSVASSEVILALIFLLASAAAVIALNLKRIAPKKALTLSAQEEYVVAGTCACNVLTGMRGGSEGSLFVPLLTALNVDTHKAIATSLFAAIFTATVGIFMYWSNGYLMLPEGIAVIIGSVIGARIGSRFSMRTKPRALELGLTVVILILAVATVLSSFV